MKNRLSLRTFFVYFLCIALPVVLLTMNHSLERLRQMRADFLSGKSEAMDHIAQTTAAQFDSLESTANEIYRSSWYKKSISQSETYRQEMNLVRQLEITGDLLYKTALLPFTEDILILNAEKESIICKYGWFSDLSKYTSAYCELDVTSLKENLHSGDLFAPIRSLQEGYWILSYPDSNRASPCRLAFLIDSAKLQQYLDQQKYDAFSSIAIGMNPSGESFRTLKRPALTLTFTYPGFDELYRAENAGRAAAALLLALVGSALLALLFTCLFTRPLSKLLQTVSYSAAKNQRDAIEGLTSHILEITEQNEALQRKMGSFATEMRGEILLRMMTGSFEGEWKETYNVSRLFPWLAAGRPYFLVITRRENPLEIPDAAFLKLEMPLDYHGYLLWAPGAEACQALRRQVLESARPLACSREHTGAQALPACYQEALAQLNARKQLIPLGEMLPLLIHLQNGEEESCLQALASLRQKGTEQEAAYVLRLLKQWAEEKGASIELPDDGPADWDAAERLIAALCGHSAVKARRSSAALIASVNRFMNEYYSLPDLSLKYLAGQFDTSVGALSRLYKQETGRNFSTALLELRMNKAKELLLHTDESLSAIALRCGYENYLSFKRAFSRFAEMAPREYREAHAAPKAGQE